LLVNDSPPIEDEEMVRAGVIAALSPFVAEEIPGPASQMPPAEATPEETDGDDAS